MKKDFIKIVFLISLLFFAGCAGAPVRGAVSLKGPIYDIDNVQYVPLSSVREAYEVGYDWDSIAKKLTLHRAGKKVVVAVGSNVALIEGIPKTLDAPVKMRHSEVVLPRRFAADTLAGLFIETRLVRRPATTEPVVRRAVLEPSAYVISRIVLDAGHGGKDAGALGYGGLREKTIVLDIAKRVKYHLEKAHIDVRLTRDSDRFVSLWKRAAIANQIDADFFISIHANAARSRSAHGFEVFYLSEAIDDSARAVAAAENAALKHEKSSFGNAKPSNDLEATLWDLEHTENREESVEMARIITNTVSRRLNMRNRGAKAARFYVLKGCRMPSVLIEAGFVSNKWEAKRLSNAQYREKLAQAIASGIINYKREYDESEGFTK